MRLVSLRLERIRCEHKREHSPNQSTSHLHKRAQGRPRKFGLGCMAHFLTEIFQSKIFQNILDLPRNCFGLRKYLRRADINQNAHTQFQSRIHKPNPISDQNGTHLYPNADQNGSKTISFARHIPILDYIREQPP